MGNVQVLGIKGQDPAIKPYDIYIQRRATMTLPERRASC
jgi:hypothetical protein